MAMKRRKSGKEAGKPIGLSVIIAMLAMAVAVDGASAWLRRRAGA